MAEEVTFSACFTHDEVRNEQPVPLLEFPGEQQPSRWDPTALVLPLPLPPTPQNPKIPQQRLDTGAVEAGKCDVLLSAATPALHSVCSPELWGWSPGCWRENPGLQKTCIQLELLIELPLVSVTVGFHPCVSVMHCREEKNCLMFGQR